MKRSILWIAALLVLTACGALPGGKAVLPEAKDLKKVTITASELELTVTGESSIAQLLELLRQSVKQDTGKASVQDIPDKGAGLVRIDFGFRKGGTSTVFLYREDESLFLEQPFQGIYEMDETLETQLRTQIAQELAVQITKQE